MIFDDKWHCSKCSQAFTTFDESYSSQHACWQFDALTVILERIVEHLEGEARGGDGLSEKAWDDYHAALKILGAPHDAQAADRGLIAMGLKPGAL